MKKVKYKCKQNDVDLKFVIESGRIDCTVIGYEDLLAGIKTAVNAQP